jgi:hypothetical protein
MYKAAKTVEALHFLFPENLIPNGLLTNPVLIVFMNAIWHCTTAAEVRIVLYETIANAEGGSAK